MWIDIQVKAFPGHQGFCVRECPTPPVDEVAAAVTRSHPARFGGSSPIAVPPCSLKTPMEQIANLGLQRSESRVPHHRPVP